MDRDPRKGCPCFSFSCVLHHDIVKAWRGDGKLHEKKIISSSKYQWLQMELSRFEEAGIIDSSQVQQILSSYEVKGKGSAGFNRILLVLGSVLIGVGILSFIAGNWEAIPRTVKFVLILFGLTGAYFTGWKLEESYPKTSKSFYYIGAAIYGAGIFLVGQMFHSSSPFQQAFLVWALGIVPLALYLKDRLVMILSILFIGIYASQAWDASVPYPYWVWVFIPLFYGCNERWLNRNRQVFFFANALLIFTIWATFVWWEWHGGVLHSFCYCWERYDVSLHPALCEGVETARCGYSRGCCHCTYLSGLLGNVGGSVSCPAFGICSRGGLSCLFDFFAQKETAFGCGDFLCAHFSVLSGFIHRISSQVTLFLDRRHFAHSQRLLD